MGSTRYFPQIPATVTMYLFFTNACAGKSGEEHTHTHTTPCTSSWEPDLRCLCVCLDAKHVRMRACACVCAYVGGGTQHHAWVPRKRYATRCSPRAPATALGGARLVRPLNRSRPRANTSALNATLCGVTTSLPSGSATRLQTAGTKTNSNTNRP